MIPDYTTSELNRRIADASKRYGPFASTHEALGVAIEEWTELVDAIRSNALGAVQFEALDLAAVLIRLHDQIETNEAMRARSRKADDGQGTLAV
jgi:NTP pyrophosphatase (non-canonical NTP hydrolase)